MGLEVVPMTLKETNAYVEQNRRHHGPVVGHKFSVGLSDGKKIVGVAIVGRPVSRHLDDGWTLEVNRLLHLRRAKGGRNMNTPDAGDCCGCAYEADSYSEEYCRYCLRNPDIFDEYLPMEAQDA